MTPTDLAAALIEDVPIGYWVKRADVLAALSRALDPALAERVGEIAAVLHHRWQQSTDYDRTDLDAADLITALLAQNAALRAERDSLLTTWAKSRERHLAAEAKVEKLRGALGHIESLSVHSGGEIHGVTAQHWKVAFEEAQDVARAALTTEKRHE